MKANMDSDNLKDWFNVAERIEYFREKKKISTRKLSLELGKSDGYVSKLLSLDFNLPSKTLFELIHCLDVSVEEFFADNYKNFKIDKELYNLIKNLPNETKESLINIIKTMNVK